MVINENGQVSMESPYELNGHQLKERKKEVIETNYDLQLNIIVHYAEGIDNPNFYPEVKHRIYRVILSVDQDTVYSTIPVMGLLNPIWRQDFEIGLDQALDDYTFLDVEVVRLYSSSDPGSSNKNIVVGRAKIPIPKSVSKKKEGRYGLVRMDNGERTAIGHIVVSMELEKIYHLVKI